MTLDEQELSPVIMSLTSPVEPESSRAAGESREAELCHQLPINRRRPGDNHRYHSSPTGISHRRSPSRPARPRSTIKTEHQARIDRGAAAPARRDRYAEQATADNPHVPETVLPQVIRSEPKPGTESAGS